MEEQAVIELPSFFPQTWQGWATLALLALYVLLREKIHRAIKKASQ